MPLVEVLNTTSSHTTPGWTYVPDTGIDPSQAAINQTTGRKRGIREPGGRTDLTSRQNTAIIRHLAELDRENHRDVQIPIPTKKDAPKDAAGRVSRAKTTPNVRRILQSQKTFRNYLDDEEAALAQAQNAGTAASQRPGPPRMTKIPSRSTTPAVSKPEQSRKQQRKSLPPPSTAPTAPEAPAGKGKGKEKEKEQQQEQEPKQEHVQAQDQDQDQQPEDPEEQYPKGLIKTEYDNDPLLRSYIPSAPSERIMQMLLAEPPLTYNAARAGPSTSGKSPRYFCTICGYWGKIRCRNCGVRTCGLDCYKIHEDSRCGAFF